MLSAGGQSQYPAYGVHAQHTGEYMSPELEYKPLQLDQQYKQPLQTDQMYKQSLQADQMYKQSLQADPPYKPLQADPPYKLLQADPPYKPLQADPPYKPLQDDPPYKPLQADPPYKPLQDDPPYKPLPADHGPSVEHYRSQFIKEGLKLKVQQKLKEEPLRDSIDEELDIKSEREVSLFLP
jgi:hypothetical protein